MSLEDWTETSIKKISHLREVDERNEFTFLPRHISAFWVIGWMRQNGFLESYNYNRFAIGKDVELSSYYLYLTTKLSNDLIGQRRVAEELSRSFMKHPDSWRILCMLIEVDSNIKSTVKD